MWLSEDEVQKVKTFTESTNLWLSGLTTQKYKKARGNPDCYWLNEVCFITFKDFPAGRIGVESILANLIPRMCGKNAELQFDYGVMGSVWFDAEVPDGPNEERPVRVALVPPKFHPLGAKHMIHVLCLVQMYS